MDRLLRALRRFPIRSLPERPALQSEMSSRSKNLVSCPVEALVLERNVQQHHGASRLLKNGPFLTPKVVAD
jgi:hypothetical protein